MQRVLSLAAVLASLGVATVHATEPKDQWPNPRLTAPVKGDRAMATTQAPASDPRKRYFVVLSTSAEPDFPGAGASVEARWKNRRLVRIPPEAVDGIARHPGVKYLQRIKERDGTALGAPEPLRATPQAASVGEVLTAWTTGYYAFDAVGNITSIGPDTWGRTQSYEYDGVNRITRGTAHTRGQTHEQTYKYDPYGNLTEIRTDGAYESIPPVDHATNRLEGVTYDDAGNLTGDGVDAYSWDGGSMMKELDSPGARQVGYVYTAGDERIGIAHGPEMYWTWTLRDDSGKVVREYESVLGLNGSACFWVEDTVHGAGRILKQERDPAEGGGRTIHADHLGSTRMVTTDDGYKVTEHQYYPFGIEASSMLQENAVGFDRETRPKFTGHERDYLGGHWVENRSYLDYMHARSYNPNLGRFLSVDPSRKSPRLGMPQSWNRYAYSLNNPVRFFDPNGKEWRDSARRINGLEGMLDHLASRSLEVWQTLSRYEGEQSPDLEFRIADVGRRLPGQEQGNFKMRWNSADATWDYDKVKTETDLVPKNATAIKIESGLITLDDGLNINLSAKDGLAVRSVIHELGHADSAARDPLGYARDTEPEVLDSTPYREREVERDAFEYEQRNCEKTGGC